MTHTDIATAFFAANPGHNPIIAIEVTGATRIVVTLEADTPTERQRELIASDPETYGEFAPTPTRVVLFRLESARYSRTGREYWGAKFDGRYGPELNRFTV